MSESRVMIAGTNSGCGKTTITCAILSALKKKGMRTAPFKCGPDYIDPMFHRHITGRPSINLDSFFLDENSLRQTMGHWLCGSDIGVVEGVMGLYDGIGTGFSGSAFDIAVKTKTPVILTVNAKGMALSLAALICGYKSFAQKLCGSEGSSLIKGVILNNVGKGMMAYVKETVEQMTGVRVVGCFERQEEAVFKSRHLGLVTAAEISDLDKKAELLGESALKTIDFEALTKIAASAPPLEVSGQKPSEAFSKKLSEASGRESSEVSGSVSLPECLGSGSDSTEKPLYLAVASDAAFCFYYEENLRLFESLGIRPVFFSPLKNEPVPSCASGLYIGGGYPEVYVRQLAKNTVTKASVKAAAENKMPLIAECGGFMYLHETIATADGEAYPMCGVISGQAAMCGRLGPFGYVDIKLKEDGLLGKAGDVIKGHEFHYSVSDNNGSSLFVSKQNGRSWSEGHCKNWLYAGYPHLYLPSFVKSALFFRDAMISYSKRD